MIPHQVSALAHKHLATPALAKPSRKRAFKTGEAADLEPLVFRAGKIYKLATSRQAPFEAFAEPTWYIDDSDFKLRHTGYDNLCFNLRTLLLVTTLVAVGLGIIAISSKAGFFVRGAVGWRHGGEQMPASRKRVNGLSIVGFIFAIGGLIFFLTGHAGIGIPQMALGAVLMANGVAAVRKQMPNDKK